MIHQGRFEGRRAVITGGASGIGLGVATRLIAEGASVCLWDLDQDAIARTIESLGAKSTGVKVNIADWEQIERAAAETVQRLGGIDVLVASAAITGPNGVLWEYPVDKWRQVIDVNVNGMFYCNRAVVPHMLNGGYGRIVNVASVAGDRADQVVGQGAGDQEHHGQRRDAGGGAHADLRPDEPAAHRLHALEDPDGALRPGRGDHRADLLDRERGVLVHDGQRVRCLGRTGDLLSIGRFAGARSVVHAPVP
jgi:hypothetical protein